MTKISELKECLRDLPGGPYTIEGKHILAGGFNEDLDPHIAELCYPKEPEGKAICKIMNAAPLLLELVEACDKAEKYWDKSSICESFCSPSENWHDPECGFRQLISGVLQKLKKAEL